jgi:uncharacterized protein (DUF885 family)
VISAKNGVQLGLPSLMEDFPVRTEADARHALARLKAMPQRIAQDIAWLREGKRVGWVTFKASLSQVPDQIDKLLAKEPADQPLLAPFNHLPPDIPADRRAALQDEAAGVLRSQVVPAFQDLRKVVVDELLPASPDNGAMSAYPDGEAVYKLFMRAQTTLPLDARAVHQIGLDEMARIHQDIDATMKQAGFTGTYAEFAAQLWHDPKWYYASGEELLAGYRDIAKRIDAEAPRLFAELPRIPYGVRAMPAYQGPDAAEYYDRPPTDGSRAGFFNANTVGWKSRPIWRMATLTAHEAVPGHHLQIARGLELRGLPQFRRNGGYVAYIEGWGVYAETLGREIGLYDDPYSLFGHLQWRAFRAARLVVDTGIHSMGWSRQQAIDFMVERTGMDRGFVTAEVDRYTSGPGQALGYMIGALKIAELRERAKAQLGSRFDVRRFHNAVLDQGALPLDVLERVIDEWISSERAGPAAPSSRAG